MISIEDLVGLITSKIADAEVNVMDRTGMKDHFMVHVTSEILKTWISWRGTGRFRKF